MTAQANTRKETRVDVAQETAKYTVGAISVASALIGLWAAACLIGGLASHGPSGLLKGFISALTGM